MGRNESKGKRRKIIERKTCKCAGHSATVWPNRSACAKFQSSTARPARPTSKEKSGQFATSNGETCGETC
jgi:hypothetical protein